jgi:ATP synthase protein I
MFRKKAPWRVDTKKIMAISSLGLMMPSSIAVGLFLGYILDKALGTRPWMLIVFFLLGTASGMYNLIRGILRLQDDKEMDETDDDE